MATRVLVSSPVKHKAGVSTALASLMSRFVLQANVLRRNIHLPKQRTSILKSGSITLFLTCQNVFTVPVFQCY